MSMDKALALYRRRLLEARDHEAKLKASTYLFPYVSLFFDHVN